MRAWIQSLLVLAACSGGEDPDKAGGTSDDTAATGDGGGSGGSGGGEGSGSGGDDAGTVPCETTLVASVPADGATDHDYRAPIVFTLAAPDAASSNGITLVDGEGAAVPGTVGVNAAGDAWTFTPDAPLTPESSYSATLSVCQETDEPTAFSVGFTTVPEIDPFTCDLTGRTFWISLHDATWVQPGTLSTLLLAQLDNDILLGVESHDGDALEVFAAADDGARGQDFCQATWDFPAADFTLAPRFSAGPADTSVNFNGVPVTLGGLSMEGEFSDDCSALEDATLEAEIDVRGIVDLLDALLGIDDADAGCQLLAGLSSPCQACASDGQVYCLPVEVTGASGVETGALLQCVPEAYCHPFCGTNDSDCDISAFPECE